MYGQLIFDKGAKTIQWRKDNIFNKLVAQLDIHRQEIES